MDCRPNGQSEETFEKGKSTIYSIYHPEIFRTYFFIIICKANRSESKIAIRRFTFDEGHPRPLSKRGLEPGLI
jgi:hypothetical protein